jgi:ubiquinone/menaquinone biosynthesis C-methylase UbiE
MFKLNSLRRSLAAIICVSMYSLLASVVGPQRLMADDAPATPPADNSQQSAPAAKPDKTPAPLKFYMGREIAPAMSYAHAKWLFRPSRQQEEDCDQMLGQLKVKPGQTVCDMGCGNGFYSLKLAKLVGEKGEVLAVDIQPEMLTMLKEKAREAGVKNIRPVLGTIVDPKLPAGKVDLIICVDVYHEFSNPEEMLAAMRKSLKPDGRLVDVEFRSEDPQVPILPLHKMSKVQIMKEFPANGFKLVEQYDKLPWQHMMFFESDGKPAKN